MAASAAPQLLRQLSLLARENAITAQEKAQGKEYVIAGWSGSVDDLLRTVRDGGSGGDFASSTAPLFARQVSWGGSDAGGSAAAAPSPLVGARSGSMDVPTAVPDAIVRQRSPEVVTAGLLPWLAVQRMQQRSRSGIDSERRLFMQCNLEMRVLPGNPGGDRAVLTGLDTVGGWQGRERMENGEEHDLIVSSRRGVGYRYVKTLKKAIYGRVELRVECTRVDDGAFVGMRAHVWRDTPTLVALKVMSKEGVLRRCARGSSAPSQEDALNEMAGLLYLQSSSSSTCKYVSTIIELIDTGTKLVKVRRAGRHHPLCTSFALPSHHAAPTALVPRKTYLLPSSSRARMPSSATQVEAFAHQGELFDFYCSPDRHPSELFDRRRAGGAPSRAQRIVAQVLAAVRHCHRHGMAHLDLSLENVLLASRRGDPDEALVIDFGMCRSTALCCDAVSGRIPAGVFYPTQKGYYVDPDIQAGRPFDPLKADIFAVGAMVFVMCSGSTAFEKATVRDANFTELAEHGFARLYERDRQLVAQFNAGHARDVAICARLDATRSIRHLTGAQQVRARAERAELEEERSRIAADLGQIQNEIVWVWFHVEPQPPMSVMVIDFIDRTLCADPARRLCVDAAMDHPWLQPTCRALGLLPE